MQIAHHLSDLWKKNKKGYFLWSTVYIYWWCYDQKFESKIWQNIAADYSIGLFLLLYIPWLFLLTLAYFVMGFELFMLLTTRENLM